MRTNNVELKLLDIAGQLINNELSLTTYDKLIEKYEERYGFTNE